MKRTSIENRDTINKALKWLTVLIVPIYCLLGSEVNDSFITHSNVIETPSLYMTIRKICYGYNFVALLAIWVTFATIFYLSGLLFNGSKSFGRFLYYSSLSLIIAIVLYAIQLYILSEEKIEILGTISETINATPALRVVRNLNYCSYSLLAVSHIFAIHFSMKINWYKSFLSIAIPIIIIIWTSELTTRL